jgi:hypothetical protein
MLAVPEHGVGILGRAGHHISGIHGPDATVRPDGRRLPERERR